MKNFTLITNNERKIKIAKDIFSQHNIELGTASLNDDVNFQEVQLWNCEDIALHSARYACQKLKKPVITTDAGYYFKAFNKGFPGPYIKWFNQGLTSEDILRLMEGKEDRRVVIREALAYCDPQGNEKVFTVQETGHIAHERSKNKGWSPINEVIVFEEWDRPFADYETQIRLDHWKERQKSSYIKLINWLKKL